MFKFDTSRDNLVCIIGPSPKSAYIGGVATHIKSLQSLSCFHKAEILDPGSLNSNQQKNLISVTNAIFQIGRRIRRKNFNCVLVNSSIYPTSFLKLLFILAAIPAGKRPVIHVFFHGGRFSFLKPLIALFLKKIFRISLGKVQCFHFLSKEQRAGFKKLFPEYPTGIYSNYATGDDIWQKNFNEDEDIFHLIFVGRIVREKGIYELLSAFEKLTADNEKVRLTIAGDGPELPELINRSAEFKTGAVRFLGFVNGSELENVYRSADLLIFPTYHHEGFPYVAIEAMRAGVPIISTSSGALDDLVIDGVTGYKVPMRDVDALVSTIKNLIDHKSHLDEMSKNCHEYFVNNLNKSAAERFYAKLLEDSL